MKINYISISFVMLLVGMIGGITQFSYAAPSLAEEEAQGRVIVEQIQSKTIQYSQLSDQQFELVGEYAMGLQMGAGHEAMNQSLVARFGETGERAMHIQMGKQFLGAGYDTSSVSSNGYGMMGGYNSSYGGYGMMNGWGNYSAGTYWLGFLYQILLIVLLVLAVVWLGRKVFAKK